MTITEAQRFSLHVELRKVLGDEVVNTMMEHLPPTGWADVVRRSDVDFRFDHVEKRLEGMDRKLNLVITTGIAFALAIVALQVQTIISIARL